MSDWRADTPPRDRPIFIKAAGCVSVVRYYEHRGGFGCFADGYDACTVHGARIVVEPSRVEYWMDIPDVSDAVAEQRYCIQKARADE